MGNHWWLLLIGAGMWAVMLGAALFRKRPTAAGCPTCAHEAGLDGKHCGGEIPDFGGWRQNEPCRCQNDYHWNYESISSSSR